MSKRTVTRRTFLQGVAGASSFTVLHLAGGGKIVAQEGTPAAAVGTYQEAPVLADLVAAGSLPPVNERLPENPLVVEPTESIGQYGGTLRSALLGGSYLFMLNRLSGYENLVRWSFNWDEVIPNIASAYEVNEDSSQYTFHLRPGMKWSDGAPFTADDVVFYATDVAGNPDTGIAPVNAGNPFTAEKVDDYTVTISLERPDGLFLKNMATSGGEAWTIFPKHYLSQFHATYNTENLDDLIAENNADDWGHLFRIKGGTITGTPYNALWQNPELPRHHVWKIVEPYGAGTRVTMDRNPYYFKIDPEGNQLPYIDGLTFEELQDAEVLLLKATAGEMDMLQRSICTVANKPILADSRESAGYNFFDAVPSIMNTNCYKLNMTHKNPAIREVFANQDFRIGLSYAINRQEIIDAIYVSQGEPWQAGPVADSIYYNETLAKQYTEYDVDQANAYLDKVIPERDGDGWRLRPDGERLSFVVEVNGAEFVEMPDTANLVVNYWREVGVDAQMKEVDRALFDQHVNANDDDCHVWPGGSGAQDALLNPYNYMPMAGLSFGKPWYNWWKKPAEPQAEPEEPPQAIQQQFALYDELVATADPDEQTRLLNEILTIAQENFWVIGIGTPAVVYGIRKNNLKNIPDSMWEAAVYPTPGPSNPAQYYFES